ncbi:MAG: hypothetical protein IKK85_08380 [Clostridia bacterium]|nr:hypothetical protein [Clostridia bacterium]
MKMKKVLALLSAAVLIFSVAGCKDKQPDTNTTEPAEDTTQEPVSQQHSEEESTAATAPPPSSTAVVVVTGGKEYGIEQPDVTSVIELVPTIAPPKTRATAPSRPTTTAKPTTTKQVTTTAKPVVIPKPEGEPDLVYPEKLYVTENGTTDSVSILGSTCEYSEESGTFRITVTFDITEYSGTRQGMYVEYNCYDKSGKKLNEKQLLCYVPLSGADKTVFGYVSAIGNTAKIEFNNYNSK